MRENTTTQKGINHNGNWLSLIINITLILLALFFIIAGSIRGNGILLFIGILLLLLNSLPIYKYIKRRITHDKTKKNI